jgi:hypothetical protein
VYSEHNQYAIYLLSPQQQAHFEDYNVNPDADGEELIVISGVDAINNSFERVVSSTPYASNNVLLDTNYNVAGGTYSTSFKDCVGLIYDNIYYAYITGGQLNPEGMGDPSYNTIMASYSLVPLLIGTGPGMINAVGGITATLNLRGIGSVMLNTFFTASTSVTTIRMLPGQFSVIYNHQAVNTLTIVNSPSLHCPGGVNAVIAPGESALVFHNGYSISVLTIP